MIITLPSGKQVSTLDFQPDHKMTEWQCPQCGEPNIDFVDWETHCAHCGRVVMVMGENEGTIDYKWNVELEPKQ